MVVAGYGHMSCSNCRVEPARLRLSCCRLSMMDGRSIGVALTRWRMEMKVETCMRAQMGAATAAAADFSGAYNSEDG
jgi:hypothetical protein